MSQKINSKRNTLKDPLCTCAGKGFINSASFLPFSFPLSNDAVNLTVLKSAWVST